MDNFKKFSADKLPDRWEFFSSVKNKHISETKICLEKNVRKTFKMNTMGNYHDLLKAHLLF